MCWIGKDSSNTICYNAKLYYWKETSRPKLLIMFYIYKFFYVTDLLWLLLFMLIQFLNVWNLEWGWRVTLNILIFWDSKGLNDTLNCTHFTMKPYFQGLCQLSGAAYYSPTWHVTSLLLAASGWSPLVNAGS